MAAGSTYTPIATTTLGSNQQTVTFSGISGSYTDLILIFNGRSVSAVPAVRMRFNSDTGSNYSYTRLYGTGSVAGSSRASSQTSGGVATAGGVTTTYETNIIIQVQNYSNTTTYKTALARANTPSSAVETNVNLWRSTSAITEVSLFTDSDQFNSGSTFTLYGIAAA